MLKEMGCNAIRTSHNPPAPELLDLCDRMGFLVMDELTDTWTYPKKVHPRVLPLPRRTEKGKAGRWMPFPGQFLRPVRPLLGFETRL